MSVRSRLKGFTVRVAGPAGTIVRVIATAGPGLLGLGLLSYGAWLAWHPAGPMVAGALILADLAYMRLRGGQE